MNRKRVTHISIILLILLTGATPGLLVACNSAEGELVAGDTGLGISRWVDEEAGVVCWVYSGFYKGGISCLPLSDTRLDVGR